MNPTVSICLITYNHSQFIKDALDGILMQSCTFPVELVVSDDCSKDDTLDIIKKHIQKFNGEVRILDNSENVGLHKNWEKAIRACKGKYIALLEGDDCWTDEKKLQLQVDILERNDSLAISCTNARVELIGSDKHHPNYVNRNEGIYTLKDLIEDSFMPTCTVLFRRKNFPGQLPESYYDAPMADFPIHILNALQGDIHYLNKVTGSYRLHTAGEWGKLNTIGRLHHILGGLKCAEKILSNTNFDIVVKKVKKDTLYRIADLYKYQNKKGKYLFYRIRTKLAI